MHNKWQIVFAFTSLSLLSLGYGHQAFAADVTAVLPSNDSAHCTALIQQGDADPVIPTSDLHGLQICMNSCDALYRNLGDQKRYSEMLAGSAYCRKSLNNLYFASIAQVINDDLDTKTQQNSGSYNSIFNQIKAKQNQNTQNQNPANNTNSNVEPVDNNTNDTPATPPANTTPSNDGINWF